MKRIALDQASRTLLLLAVMCLLVPFMLWLGEAIDSRDELIGAAEAAVRSNTATLHDTTARLLAADRSALRRIDLRLSGVDWDAVAAIPGMSATLSDVATGVADAALILGPDGTVLAASDRTLVGQDFGQRDLFRDALDQDRLVVSRLYPDLGTGGWGLAISRRLAGPDGRLGVVAFAVSVDRVFALYRALTADPDDAAILLRPDGTPILRFPPRPSGITASETDDRLAHEVAAAPAGLVRIAGPYGRRLVGFARLPEDDLVVAFERSVGRVEAARRRILVHSALMATGGMLALLLVSSMIMRQLARDRSAAARLSETSEQLRQVQKMEALGQLTGGVAHDFNNLLTVIQGNVILLRRDRGDAARRARLLDGVERAADRAAGLTRHLLAFARKQPLTPSVLDLNELLRSVLDLLLRSLPPQIRVTTDFEAGLKPILADATLLEMAILNIALNARDAMPEGGTLTFTTRLGADGMIVLTIADTGAGMDPATLARAFEPFFTTKEVGSGTGLGLSMVYGFVQQSGGRIALDSTKGVGTTLRIELPITRRTREAPPPSVTGDDGAGNRILLVEDQEAVGTAVAAMLRDAGFEVEHVGNAASALERIDEGFDMVLTDIFMPGTDDGMALAEKLRKIDPAFPVLLITGSGQAAIEARAAGFAVLPKPFTLEALVQAILRARRQAEVG